MDRMAILRTFLKVGLEVAKAAIPAIATVEVAVRKAKSGGDKKTAVVEIVKVSPMIAELLANKEIVDEKLFAEGVAQVNDGYVKIMNSLGQPTT